MDKQRITDHSMTQHNVILGDRQKEGIVELADARAVTECIISI
jgi:hypothetical protein